MIIWEVKFGSTRPSKEHPLELNFNLFTFLNDFFHVNMGIVVSVDPFLDDEEVPLAIRKLMAKCFKVACLHIIFVVAAVLHINNGL